jgi:hypothetical protein
MSTDDLDRRIHDALQFQGDQLSEDSLTPGRPPSGPTGWLARHRWAIPLVAAAAVAAIAGGTTIAVTVTRGDHHRSAAPALSSSGPAPSSAVPSSAAPSSAVPSTASHTTAAPSSPAQSSASSTVPTPTFVLGYQPLWPFGDYARARAWQLESRTSGVQPWHLDAPQTALGFASGYLGFTELNRVTSSRVAADGAHVGVGYLNPNGVAQTAAVLHLVRFGPDADSPWEVVGTDDTSFSLEQPSYGSTVSSPMTVGGHITGVDEAIVLSVRSLAGGIVNSPVSPLPAGGDHQPWSAPVAFHGSGTLTIVAYIGGHLQRVERFAVQGVHT